jgi:hypothetical protein
MASNYLQADRKGQKHHLRAILLLVSIGGLGFADTLLNSAAAQPNSGRMGQPAIGASPAQQRPSAPPTFVPSSRPSMPQNGSREHGNSRPLALPPNGSRGHDNSRPLVLPPPPPPITAPAPRAEWRQNTPGSQQLDVGGNVRLSPNTTVGGGVQMRPSQPEAPLSGADVGVSQRVRPNTTIEIGVFTQPVPGQRPNNGVFGGIEYRLR